VRARLTDGSQVASFDVHVTSQPKTDVTVTLTTTSGSLSAGQLTFTGSNWTQPQRVTLTGVATSQATTVRLTSTSGDSRYGNKTTQQRVVPSSWSSELELSLWEGGTVLAAQPAASVAAIDGTEGTTSRFGFELALGAVATSSPVELLYTLAAGSGMSLAGSAADVRHSPDATYHPLVLANSGSGDAAFANLGSFTTVSDAGELSGQAWVRRDKAEGGDTVLEFSNASGQHQIWLGFPDSTNKPRLQLRSSSGAVLARLTSDVPLALAEWNHLAFSIDGNKVASLYVNGELVARQTLASGLSRLARSSNLLGRSLNGERLDGAVRGVAIWNAARTQDEIRASMLGETASGSGLVSSLPLNNSLGNGVSSAPAAVLSSNSSNTAGFAAVPIYGLRLPAGDSQVGVPLVVLDDLTAENDETLTLTLVDSGFYSLGGASGTGTAELADDDSADVEFLAAWSNLDATSSGWTSTGRFTVSESDEARSSHTRLGIRLTSRPTDTVTLRLKSNTGTTSDIRTTLAGSPTATAIELVFTPDNWDQVQELLLQGRDDTSIDGDIERSLDFTITTTDAFYKVLAPSVTVLVLDDDTATANEGLAAAQNAQAPIAQISAPTRTTIQESGSDSAEFTITLSQPAAQDTLVFFDLEQSNRQLNARDFVVTPSQNAQALVGLARFETAEATNLKINFQHPDAATPSGYLADSGRVYGDRGNSRTYGWSSDHTDLGRDHGINSDQLLDTHMHFQEGATWEVSLPNGVYEVTASVGDARFSSTHTLNVEGVSFFSAQQLSANEFARTTATVTVSDGRLTLDQGSAARKATRINYLEIRSTGGTGAETASVDADGINETSSTFPAAGGSFSTTWSGYIAVPETGSYTFTVPVRGGVRLVLDGTTVIDQWIDTQATWSTESLQLTRGDFVAFTLDYTSFNTATPAVALQWERPRNNGTDTVTETIPAEAFSRVDGIHLLIAAGSTSASVTVRGLDDSIDEDDETLVARLLAARGVELVVKSQTDATDGGTQLELALGTTDREAVTLAAGTVLALGRSVEISGSKGSTVARFTLAESVTLHRDRTLRVKGTLAWVDEPTRNSFSGSAVDLVASVQGDLYQVLDRSVTLTLGAPLAADAASGTDRYLASLTLGSTNRSSVELAAGTELVYRNDSTGDTATLVLVNNLSLESGQAAGSVPVRVEVVTLGLDLTSSTSPLTGLTSRVDLPTSARLTITDDDAAGIAFFLDDAGFEPADGSRATLVEGGASLTRHVRLTSQPNDSVTLYLETNDASEARLQIPAGSPEDPTARIALTFTPENWKVPQAFRIVPVDDRLVDGSQSVEIHARTTSSDPFYKIASAGTKSMVARINFQLGSAETPDGYLADSGQVFGDRNHGWSYGWSTDHTEMGRDRNKNADQRLDTLIGIKNGRSWEIDLGNGVYEVSASIGDAEFTGTHTLNIEGVSYFSARSLAANEFGFRKALVTVSDGRLTIDAGSSSATRINYLEIALSRPVAETLLLQDNDTSGVKVELQQSSIAKAGNGFINLSLTAEPTADVVVTLSPSDRQFTINDRSVGRSETLVFTPANWATLQTVGLSAVDDNAVEDVSTSSLTFATTSDDARFDGLAVETVSIVIIDNDLPTATLERISDGAEEGRPGRFRIRLSDATASSVGSKGLVVNYSVTAVDLDSSLSYGSSVGDRLGKIAQTPTSVSGTVRIPPGQAQSDVLVVPIDDFLADSTSKSITVALASGDGYTVGSDSSRTTATVKIINNDVAGILVMTSGERVFVKESGSSATYQLALTSEPKSTVSVTISEKVASGASRQLGTSSEAFSTTVTFTRDNWFTPQQISVRAFDDYRIEDGSGSTAKTGIHAAQLAYRFASSDTDYDTASHSGDSGHFTNFVQSVDVLDYELADTTATSMQSSLTSLQEGIDSLSLPMVGSLTGKTGQGLRKFINDLTNSIRQVGTPTPSRLSRLITRDIAAALGVSEDAISVSLSMKDTSTTNPAVVVRFGFSDAYTVFSVPLAADFGLPGLGFQTQGSFDASFSYDAGLELVFPRSGDIYLNTADDKTFVTANFNAGLSENFSLTGGLGFMQLDAVNQPSVNDNVQIGDEPASTELDVSFELFVNGGAAEDGSLSYTELTSSSLDLEEVFQYSFSGNAAMSFGVTTSVNGSAAIPSFKFELSALLPLFDYSNQEQSDEPSSATTFYFDDIRLDLGSYITDMLSPIVDGLDGILKPLYPLVDALYKDTKIFATVGLEDTFDVDQDGQTSTIDLSRWFAGFYATIDRDRGQRLAASVEETVEFLDMLKGVMDLVRDLERLSDEEGFYVSFGSYELAAWKAGDDDADPADEEVDEDAESLSDDTKEQADQGGKDEDGKSKNAFAKVMEQLDELGITIPLIEEPANVVKLLFGQDVSLFEWRMPGMGMSSEIDKTFPIYGGIEGVIEGGYEVEAHLGFGFDTYGLSQWRRDGYSASSSWKVFNGFYVADLDKNGKDIPEFTMDASMGAGLGYSARVVRADITGGLEAAVSLDLLDEGEIAGTSDGKIRGREITDRISNPLNLFELSGELIAYVKSRVQIGVDLGFYSIWKTVWERRLAEIPIFQFGIGGRYGSGSVSNGHIANATVFFDANFNGRIDSLEPVTTSDADGRYTLDVDLRTFDRNRNGRIDADEGQLVVFGGTDTSMDQKLQLPFAGPLGGMVTPLTTLHNLAVTAGVPAEEVRGFIAEVFELGSFDYLTQDPLRILQEATSFDDPATREAVNAYLAHIKLHFAWDLISGALQNVLPDDVPNSLAAELELLKGFAGSFRERPTAETLKEGLGRAIADAWKRANPDSDPLVGDLAARATELAGAAGLQMAARLDAIRDDALRGGARPAQLVEAVHSLKRQAFGLYREALDGISDGLYRITDPDELVRTVAQRLAEAHGDFINQSPVAVDLVPITPSLPENAITVSRILLAAIVVSDDGFGTNTISLTGADAARFEVDGLALYLKAGVTLDYETQSSYEVRVRVVDGTAFGAVPVEATFTLHVTDVNEPAVFIDVATGETRTDATSRSGTEQLVKRGGGVLVLSGASTHTGGTVVEAGEVIVRNPLALGSGSLIVQAGAKVTLDVPATSDPIASVPVNGLILATGGLVDVGYGSMTLRSGSYSLPTVLSLLQGGYAANWSGASGIISRAAGKMAGGGVGYVINDDGSLTFGFAASGDTNLDGTVDILDASAMLVSSKFNTGAAASWSEGDSNYDGVIDVLDISDLLGAALFNVGTYIPAQSSQTQPQSTSGSLSALDAAFLALAADTSSSGSTSTKRRRSGAI